MAYVPYKQAEADRRKKLGLRPRKECKWSLFGEAEKNYFDKKRERIKKNAEDARFITLMCD